MINTNSRINSIDNLEFDNPHYFVRCMLNECELLNNLKDATVTRLIQLSTYVKFNKPNSRNKTYDRLLKNDDNKLITNQNIMDILNIKRITSIEFVNELINNNCLFKTEAQDKYGNKVKGFILNEDIFKRGKVVVSKKNRCARLYIEPTRILFHTTPIKNHVHIGNIYKLMPYINYKWNILCCDKKNAMESDRDEIIPMTLNEFCNLIGYSSQNRRRILRVYDDIKFEYDGVEQPVIKYVFDSEFRRFVIMVNPNLFYAGSYDDRDKQLAYFFGESNDKYGQNINNAVC